MARKPTRKRRRRPGPARRTASRRRSGRRGRRPWLRHWKRALAVLLAAAAAWAVYLDVTIRTAFEGKRWALPAHVYARPLELYEGAPLAEADFRLELKRLAYRPAYIPEQPGTYSHSGSTWVVHTRGFDFWDGTEPPRIVQVHLGGGRVQRLTDAGGRAVDLVRLDPMFIGGIYPSHHEDRVLVQLEDVPPLLVEALIAVEDRKFRHHHGIDLRAIARAAWANLRVGAAVQGGSTLTQQLVKNFFLSNERSLWRKANEAVMALLLELHYDKDEILEAYLNEVYLGQQGKRAIHGFGLASRFYFDKPVGELDLAEIATLVALVRGPGYYDPRRHPRRLQRRRDRILDILVERNVVSAGEAAAARSRPVRVVADPPHGITPYPAFMDLVRRQLRRDYRDQDLTSEGLRVFTTLDPVVQARAEAAVAAQVAALDRARGLDGRLQAAVIVTSTTGGEVLALVGGRDARFAGFNRALDARRAVGSLVKPVVYLTALAEGGYTLAAPVDDSPIRIGGPGGEEWVPANYDHVSHGEVPLFVALTRSYNQATVRLGMALGVKRVAAMLRRLGLEREVPAYPSLLLGAVAMSPEEVAAVYQTFAAGGFRSPPRAIREVLDARGEPLKRFPLDVEQAVDPAAVALLNSALREVMRHGTGRAARQWFAPAGGFAGKTGTTDDLRDSWFAGFGRRHLAVVWLGRDDNAPIGLSGAAGALRVWSDLMRRLHAPPLDPPGEDGLDWVEVDPASGLRAAAGCEGAALLAFRPGTAPGEYAPCSTGLAERASHWLRRILR